MRNKTFAGVIELVEKFDTILFILGLIVVGLLLAGIANAYAGVETVKDDNDGNKGYILINTGTKNGQSDVGHWTDITTIPELKGAKGDKGDTGATGQQGIQGIAGNDGINGINGIDGINGLDGQDGYTPLKGVDYFDGKDGLNGIDGLNGLNGLDGLNGENGKDVDPTTVTNLQNTDTILQNNINTESVERINNHTTLNNRINDTNSRIDNVSNRVSKLEKTQLKAQLEFRVLDTKRVTVSPYVSQDFTRGCIDEAGVRITIKLGTSYEEREIIKTNKRLDNLETYLGTPEVKEAIQQVRMNKIKVNTNGKSFWINKEF
jgi:hypothetical protein